ncbi:DUF7373 family lipoprotein [Nocardia salmonicida]|uniref:DUF7373 family lipoprotein n=2 Tax=Nocardia salmonicida TaxID=53431 RepID=UPI0007A41836|nr:hypothetical protein [Nocardia salmonicida]
MLFRPRRLAALIALVCLAGTACGDGTSVDIGEYSAQPTQGDYDDGPSLGRGILVESLRLGERIVSADSIDPELSFGRGGGVQVNHLGIADDMLPGVQRAALHEFELFAGFGAIAGNDQLNNDSAYKSLNITVLAFADEPTALRAAQTMAAVDFGANEGNVGLPLPGFPAALSHWRPGVPTIGSLLVWKNHVIRLFAKIVEPNEAALVDLAQRVYTTQLAEFEGFTPTPIADLPNLKLDPNRLLPRLVSTGYQLPDSVEFAVYPPRAFALMVGRPGPRSTAFRALGVSAIAVSHNKFLYKMDGAEKTPAMLDYLRDDMLGDRYVAMSGVPGLSAVRCVRALRPDTASVEAIRFECHVPHGDAIAVVRSNRESDVRHLAAAQYQVMGGSQ